jgi:hypothetical protein
LKKNVLPFISRIMIKNIKIEKKRFPDRLAQQQREL